mmetsp:Transcript_23487/g.41326  ORF Transcript_23487/g.41326 Transcript_23487/m.41326 type:complete len:246 (+) Transcript_23487:1005-1742(+)
MRRCGRGFGRCDPCRTQDLQGFAHLIRDQTAPRPVVQLIQQGHIGQCIDCISQIDQQLAPLHCRNVGMQGPDQIGRAERRQGPRLHQYVPGTGPVKGPCRLGHDIEGHNAGPHISQRERPAQSGGIAHPVLQADNLCLGGNRRDMCGHFKGGTGFDSNQHQVCPAERRARIIGHEHVRHMDVEPAVIRQAQPVLRHRLYDPGATQEPHVVTMRGKKTAHKTADTARACNADARAAWWFRHPNTNA